MDPKDEYNRLQEQIDALREKQLDILRKDVCPEVIDIITDGNLFALCDPSLKSSIEGYIPYYPTRFVHIEIYGIGSHYYFYIGDRMCSLTETHEDKYYYNDLCMPVINLLSSIDYDINIIDERIKYKAQKCIMIGSLGNWTDIPSDQEIRDKCLEVSRLLKK